VHCCHYYRSTETGDNLFSIDLSRIRFGPGSLAELGWEISATGCRRIGLFTDSTVKDLELFDVVVKSLQSIDIEIQVYDEVSIEPTDTSFQDATLFAMEERVDGFISIGGGSVIDTCKAANLFSTYPAAFPTYVNAPLGDGQVVPGPLKPHIACPTTSGTGSECTGIAVFDFLGAGSKTGIMSRYLLPDMAIIDPRWTRSLPQQVVAATGFDAISHALESLTARPHNVRTRPQSPDFRPMTQGANPWSDLLCSEALRLAGNNFVQAVIDPDDFEARYAMMYAATLSGAAFGNAGCHLPHAMSYPISALVRNFPPEGYSQEGPMCPHGISVIVSAPAAYSFTSESTPVRHMQGASLLGAETKDARPTEAGLVLSEHLLDMMQQTGMPNGIQGVGFTLGDIDDLVVGALSQERLLSVSPRKVSSQELKDIYVQAFEYW